MKVAITGMDGVHKINERFMNPKNLLNETEKLIKETAKLIRLYAPRMTGALEDSIYYTKTSNNTWAIIIGVPYAVHMEYGTKYFPVGTVETPLARTSTSGKPCYHPFIRSSMWIMMNKYPEYLRKAFFIG